MAKSLNLIRVSLECFENGVLSRTNVYVDDHPDLKLNCYITLSDSSNPNSMWKVVAIHEKVERTSIKIGWNNNI